MAKDTERRRRAIRRFYDWLGTRLDSQSFYEQSGLDILVREGRFEQAHDVFEFGCGTGRLAEQLLSGPLPPDARYTAIDLSPRMVEITRSRLAAWQDRVEISLSDGSTRLNYPDGSFDRFISTYVIDLLDADESRELISEAHRVLRGDGLLCLVSITSGVGFFSRLLMAGWKWLNRLSPILTGGCRPVCLRRLVGDEGWHTDHHEVLTRFGVAMEVLLARRRAGSRFQQLVESTAAIPWEVDLATWRFVYVGPQVEKALGYPVEDWYEEGFWPEHIHPEDRDEAMNYCATATERGEDHEFEYRMLTADGRVVWLRNHVWILYEGGKAKKLQGFMFDITERKLGRQRLEQSEAKFRALFDSTEDAIAIIHDGVFVDCNPAAQEMFACTREELLGATPVDFSPPTQYDGRNSTESALEKIVASLGGETQRFDWQHQRSDGSLFDAEVTLNRIELDGLTCVQGTMRDISARRRQDDAVRSIAAGVAGATGEEFFSNLVTHLAGIFEASYAFVGVLDEKDSQQVNTVAIYANGDIAENFSYRLEGTPCADVVGQTTCAHGTGVQRKFPDDHLLAEMGVDSYIGSPLFDAQGRALGLLVVMDTRPLKLFSQAAELMEIFAARAGVELERMRIETHLRESQGLLQLVLDAIPVRVFWKDRNSVYLGCNQHFAHDAGLENAGQIIGKNDYELGWREQAELYRGDDRQVMESGLARLDYEEPQSGSAGEQRWLRTSKIPLRGMDGEVFGVLGIYEDITERKHTEEALRRSQKMEAIGQLSGGIAHDFNNQLGVVIGYLDFLSNYHENNDQSRQWVEVATRATLRCMDLTRQLLAFSRRQAQRSVIVDVNERLRELKNMIARSLTPEVEVQYQLATDLWRTQIDPGEFEDVILNLVINARDAMPLGGRLVIETSNYRLTAEQAARRVDLPVGEYVQVLVDDTGEGMDHHVLERAFEPFFTTKPEGKGTGLGLAMVYGFARRYGGGVEAYSERDVGTKFRLYLPRATGDDDSLVPGRESSAQLPRGHETILVVDDEIDLLQLAEAYLRDLGYQVMTAENANEALDVLQREPSVDLLFSDVVMPGGMNGYELAWDAVALRPGLRVLLTTGFTSQALSHNGLARFSANLIGKPYRKDELAQRVRLVLDTPVEELSGEETPGLEGKFSGRTVLVVDDEEDMRELFRLKLERLGCRVLVAGKGADALELYRQGLDAGAPPDAVIVDLTLPGGMGGADIAAQLRIMDPQARLIVTSGDPAAKEMTDFAACGFSASIEKDALVSALPGVIYRIFSND